MNRRKPFFMALGVVLVIGGALAEQSPGDPVEEAKALIKQGKYAEAEAKARALFETCEAKPDSSGADCAGILDVVVESLWRSGKARDPNTRELARTALTVKEEALGTSHPDLAESLNNLAVVDFFLGEYREARTLWERALVIRQEALGPNHPDVAQLMNNLGNLYLQTGDFGAALPVYDRALAIRLETLGPDHPLVAQSYGNLAVLRTEMGDYAEALPLAERSVALYKKLLPPGHPKIATSEQGLARVLLETGEVERALEMLAEVEALWEKALGPEHPSYGSAVNNRADQLRKLGRYAEAQAAYDKALEVLEGSLGPEHPQVAGCLSGMGALAEAEGQLARAIELQERVVAIKETAMGADHPRLALSLTDLGRLRLEAGEIESARALLDRAVSIRIEALGADHPDVADSLIVLAELEASAGSATAAVTHGLEAEEIMRKHLRLTGRSLSERHALSYAGSRERGLDVALTVAAERELGADLRERLIDAVVRSRAVILDGMAARHRSAVTSPDAEIARKAEELASARTRLANFTTRGLGNLDPETYRALLDEARVAKERAERALAEASADFAAELERGRIGLADVRRSLPPKTAMVSYVVYRDGSSDGRSYLAFLLQPGDSPPSVFPLGTAEEIDRLVATWRRETSSLAVMRDDVAEALQANRRAGEALRRRVWDPVVPRLVETERVLVVPDGSLNLVSLAALPVTGDRYLIESGPALSYASAERDLVASGEGHPDGAGLLAVGAPDYDRAALARRATGDSGETGATRLRSAATSGCAELSDLTFDELPATAIESEVVVGLWERTQGESQVATYLTGAAASETAFKTGAPGRRVLHLATHGFFLGRDCSTAIGSGSTRGVAGIAPSKSSSKAPETGMAPEQTTSPLLLSGLALAGANRKAATDDGEDGILTAEEIASLDLTGVELVVLSACDTGVGEVQAGEGVFGLRRAMQIAGVDSQVISLWSVDDDSTREWMEAFYESMLQRRVDVMQAAHDAGLAVLSTRRDAELSPHPFYWAAFVATSSTGR